jgi:hypothetical protein
MILPGHVAAAYLAARATRANLRASIAAAMFPDLIDKPTRWLWRLTPNDRIPAHSALFWSLTSGLAYLVGGSQVAAGWAVGYGAHLLCDEANAHLNPGRVYWLWPFKRYALHRGPTGLQSSLSDFSGASVVLEGLLTIVGGLVWDHSRRQAHRAAQIR